jgi:hypothetical protein
MGGFADGCSAGVGDDDVVVAFAGVVDSFEAEAGGVGSDYVGAVGKRVTILSPLIGEGLGSAGVDGEDGGAAEGGGSGWGMLEDEGDGAAPAGDALGRVRTSRPNLAAKVKGLRIGRSVLAKRNY